MWSRKRENVYNLEMNWNAAVQNLRFSKKKHKVCRVCWSIFKIEYLAKDKSKYCRVPIFKNNPFSNIYSFKGVGMLMKHIYIYKYSQLVSCIFNNLSWRVLKSWPSSIYFWRVLKFWPSSIYFWRVLKSLVFLIVFLDLYFYVVFMWIYKIGCIHSIVFKYCWIQYLYISI